MTSVRSVSPRRAAARVTLSVAALVGLTGLVAPATPAMAAKTLTANCDTTVGDPSISSSLSPEEVQRRLQGETVVQIDGVDRDDRPEPVREHPRAAEHPAGLTPAVRQH